jgi:hypothetical protein
VYRIPIVANARRIAATAKMPIEAPLAQNAL